MSAKSAPPTQSAETEVQETDFIDAEFTAADFAATESVDEAPEAETFPLIALDLQPTAALSVIEAQASDSRPALVYLARLAPGSRRTMSEALTVIAGKVSA